MEISTFEQRVIFEDNHLLVVNKPNNILVQGDRTGDRTLLDVGKAYLKDKYNKPGNVFLGLVHRLDRPVSGVLIMARTSKALTRLNKQLRDKGMDKSYVAISNFKPEETIGIIENHLSKNSQKNIVFATLKPTSTSKKATTQYRLVKSKMGQHLFQLNPITGRSHQLRVHLSGLHAVILGDLKYGAKYPLPDKSIALHCREMIIVHPVTKEKLRLIAELPESEHWNLFR